MVTALEDTGSVVTASLTQDCPPLLGLATVSSTQDTVTAPGFMSCCLVHPSQGAQMSFQHVREKRVCDLVGLQAWGQ